MNPNLLSPALQGIINAVDALPDRSSRHFSKNVLDAVEEGRKALESPSLTLTATVPTVTGYYWVQCPSDYPDAIVVYFDTDFLSRVSFCGGDETCKASDMVGALWSERLEFRCNLKDIPDLDFGLVQMRNAPSKQRITLRGGPLDGCWYWCFISFQELAAKSVMREATMVDDNWNRIFYYSLPDSHGVCYYRV